MIGADSLMEGQTVNEQRDKTPVQRWQRLLEFGMAFSESAREDLGGLVSAAATELTDSDMSALLLLDPATGKLHAASDASSDEIERSGVPVEGSAAGWILRHGQPLVVNDAAAAPGDYIETQATDGVPTTNLAGVPLSTRGRIVGVLEVCNKREGRSYHEQDVQVLHFLATFAAMAIDNDRLLQQTDLISEFMHELKTPLMALTAASELLARDLQAKKQIELVEMIQRETMRLSKMAQDFLDLTRLESGRAQITFRPVDLAEVLYDVIRLQEPQASNRDISIVVEVEENLPAIKGDYDRLRQVFLNLTSNAIKYNDEQGRVTVKASCQQDGELRVDITDTGPGIAAENLPHLFERFYRIPDSEGFTKGTGLGLSIAARILQEHGGRIDVESELGRGSTFRCYLPIQQ